MSTIQESIQKYKQGSSVNQDFENTIKTIISAGTGGVEIPNNCFTHALIIMDMLLRNAKGEIRILTGNFFGTIFDPLYEIFKEVSNNFQKKEHCFIRVIDIVNGRPKGNIIPGLTAIRSLPKIELMRANYDGNVTYLQHYLCSDNTGIRIESGHQILSLQSDEDLIEAKAYFNNPSLVKMYCASFDRIWEQNKR